MLVVGRSGHGGEEPLAKSKPLLLELLLLEPLLLELLPLEMLLRELPLLELLLLPLLRSIGGLANSCARC